MVTADRQCKKYLQDFYQTEQRFVNNPNEKNADFSFVEIQKVEENGKRVQLT